MKKWCVTLGVLVALLLAAVLPVSAAGYGPVVAESEIFNVTISGQQNYDEISRELVLLNQERAKAGLHPLKLDPTLTAYAMQRAAEISVFYGEDHSRPDTSGCFSIFQGVYANTSGYGENAPADTDSVAAYAADAMAWAYENQIIKGEDGLLKPEQNATRAQIANIFMRFEKSLALASEM